MEVTGKVLKVLPEVTGQGQNGEWKKIEFVIETEEQYPKKICICAWGNKVDVIKSLNSGESVKVGINIESREYNQKWYTDVKMWKIDKMGGVQSSQPQMDNLPPEPDEDSDLPF
jgi:hypothetical protein